MQEFESIRSREHIAKNLASREGGEHWLLRHSSSSLFFSSSIIVLATWTFAYSLYFFHRIGRLAYPNNSEWLVALCIVIAFLAVPASLYLLIGMMWYWVKFDESGRLVKGVWLLSFVTLAWLAAAAYYFTVYRRQFSSRRRSLSPS